MNQRRTIVHIINSMEFGGAEAMLCNLVLHHDSERWKPLVVTLIDDMSVAGPLIDAGVPIMTVGMRGGIPDPRGLVRLARLIRRLRPDLVQTWMDHSNLIGGLAARLGARAPVIWSLHHSNHIRGVAKRTTLMTVAACARLSRLVPASIVSCSHHGRRQYVEHGFDSARMCVIPNGFDTDYFRPDPDARASFRQELGVAPATLLIGLAARFDPVKDHDTFLAAARRLAERAPRARFVLCGQQITTQNPALTAMVQAHGIGDRCHLLGPRRDMPRVHAAMDAVVSSSISEAFPLVLGEAMLCETMCVATDVGDSSMILDDFGWVVPPRDPEALARACVEVLEMPESRRRYVGRKARGSVCARFGLDAVTRAYERLYEQVLEGTNGLENAVMC